MFRPLKFELSNIILLVSLIARVSTICSTRNIPARYSIDEDVPIGHTEILWSTSYDPSWEIEKPSSGFVDVYKQNGTDKLEFYLNVTDSSDVDNQIPCDGRKNVNLTLKCYDGIHRVAEKVMISIFTTNDHTPELINNKGLTTEVKEDTKIFTHIIEYGRRVKDEDCPTQLINYTVVAEKSAQLNERDGTKYFDIYENGTLFLKQSLDYERIKCSLGEAGELYLKVLLVDVDHEKIPRTNTGTVSLTLTVLNVDDEHPKFIDNHSECSKQCSTCEQTSYSANVTYDYTGHLKTNPEMVAEDIEKNGSVILYYIREIFPTEYEDIFAIDQQIGTINLIRSFKNISEDNKDSDFDVSVVVQAMSNRTQLETKNVTITLTVNVPPPTTTVEQTTTEMTTTEELTTTEQQTTPEVIETTITHVKKDTGNNINIIVIVVPIAAVVLLLFIIILIYVRRIAISATKKKYTMESKSGDIKTNGIKVEKVTR